MTPKERAKQEIEEEQVDRLPHTLGHGDGGELRGRNPSAG